MVRQRRRRDVPIADGTKQNSMAVCVKDAVRTADVSLTHPIVFLAEEFSLLFSTSTSYYYYVSMEAGFCKDDTTSSDVLRFMIRLHCSVRGRNR